MPAEVLQTWVTRSQDPIPAAGLLRSIDAESISWKGFHDPGEAAIR
jgi:hypothetical protein